MHQLDPAALWMLRAVFGMGALTLIMAGCMGAVRIPTMQQPGLSLRDAAHTADIHARLPSSVRRVVDNYNHLFEAPTVFYAVTLAIIVAGLANPLFAGCAWVLSRIPCPSLPRPGYDQHRGAALCVLHSVLDRTCRYDCGPNYCSLTRSTRDTIRTQFALSSCMVRQSPEIGRAFHWFSTRFGTHVVRADSNPRVNPHCCISRTVPSSQSASGTWLSPYASRHNRRWLSLRCGSLPAAP